MQHLLKAQAASNSLTIVALAVGKCVHDIIECAEPDDGISEALLSVELNKLGLLANQATEHLEALLIEMEEFLNERSKDFGI